MRDPRRVGESGKDPKKSFAPQQTSNITLFSLKEETFTLPSQRKGSFEPATISMQA